MSASTPNENYSNLIWQLSIGSTLAWELAKFLGSDHPYLATLSVILCLHTTLNKTIGLSIKRVFGTIIGIIVTVLISSYIKISGLNLGLLILLGCFITKWLKFDKIVIHQVALTILFVYVLEHKEKHFAIDRMRDTLVGVVVAVLIQMVWFRIFLRKNNNMSRIVLINEHSYV